MDDLLTTKQVQDFLKVDRITVYRMLNEGRLKAVKIGQQWRFPIKEVERLLSGDLPIPEAAAAGSPCEVLPAHCIQSIQDLFTGMCGLSAITLDLSGTPVTDFSSPCAQCQASLTNTETRAACEQAWREMASRPDGRAVTYHCPAGGEYLLTPVHDEGVLVAWFAVQQAAPLGDAPEESIRHQVADWSGKAAATIEGILKERAGLMNRLQQIAQLTQLS